MAEVEWPIRGSVELQGVTKSEFDNLFIQLASKLGLNTYSNEVQQTLAESNPVDAGVTFTYSIEYCLEVARDSTTPPLSGDSNVLTLNKLARHFDQGVRLAVARNSNTSTATLHYLAEDESWQVREMVAKNPNTQAGTKSYLGTLDYLAMHDDNWRVRLAVAKSEKVVAETLDWIAKNDGDERVRREVVKNENVASSTLDFLVGLTPERPYIDESKLVRVEIARSLIVNLEGLDRLAEDLETDVKTQVAKNLNVTPTILRKLASDPDWRIRLLVAKSENATEDVMNDLMDYDNSHADPNSWRVRMAIIKSPLGEGSADILYRLAYAQTEDPFYYANNQEYDWRVKLYVAKSSFISAGLLNELSKLDDADDPNYWNIRLAVAKNINTEVVKRSQVSGITNSTLRVMVDTESTFNVLLAIAKNMNADTYVFKRLIERSINEDWAEGGWRVRVAIAKNYAADAIVNTYRSVFEDHNLFASGETVLGELADDEDYRVRVAVAKGTNINTDILLQLADDTVEKWQNRRDEAWAEGRFDAIPALEESRDNCWRVRLSVPKNVLATADILDKLADDDDWRVKVAVAKSEGVEIGSLAKMAADDDIRVQLAVVKSEASDDETPFANLGGKTILKYLASLSDNDNPENWRIRSAVAKNESTNGFTLDLLAGDAVEVVRVAVAKHTNVLPGTFNNLIEEDESDVVKAAAAKNDQISEDNLNILIGDTDDRWDDAGLQIRVNAVKNAKAGFDALNYVVNRGFEGQEDISVILAIAKKENPLVADIDRFLGILEKLSDYDVGADSWQVRLGLAKNSLVALPILDKLADDEDYRVRLAVARSAVINVDVLTRLAEDAETKWQSRRDEAWAEGRFDAISTLEESRDNCWQVRLAVAKSVLVTVDILDKLADDDDWRIKITVAKSEGVEIGSLAKMADDGDIRVQLAVVKSEASDDETPFANLGGKTILKYLASLSDNDNPENWRVRLAVAKNENTNGFTLDLLAGDAVEIVRVAVAKHANVLPGTFNNLIEEDESDVVKAAAAKNDQISEDNLNILIGATDNRWDAAALQIRINAVRNANAAFDALNYVVTRGFEGKEDVSVLLAIAKKENPQEGDEDRFGGIIEKLSTYNRGPDSWQVRAMVIKNNLSPAALVDDLARDDADTRVKLIAIKSEKISLAMLETLAERAVNPATAEGQTLSIGLTLAKHAKATEGMLDLLSGALDWRVRYTVARQEAATTAILTKLRDDEIWRVRRAVAKNVNTNIEDLKMLAGTPPYFVGDEHWMVRSAVTKNPHDLEGEYLSMLRWMTDEDNELNALVRRGAEKRLATF